MDKHLPTMLGLTILVIIVAILQITNNDDSIPIKESSSPEIEIKTSGNNPPAIYSEGEVEIHDGLTVMYEVHELRNNVLDCSIARNAKVVLKQNLALNIINSINNMTGYIHVTQDRIGGWDLDINNSSPFSINPTPNKSTIISWYYANDKFYVETIEYN